jgi:hypothetical protein
MIIIIIKVKIGGKPFCEKIVTRAVFAQKTREKQEIVTGQHHATRRKG